jgi:hypothetical protein
MKIDTIFTKLGGIAPALRDFLQTLFVKMTLPPISGEWFFVDPEDGSASASGKSMGQAVKNIRTAYALCTTGDGDGIVLISSGTTAAHTTSYLTYELDLAKNGVRIIGLASRSRKFGRARIANKDLTSTGTTFAQTASTITRETGSFVTDGWEVGCTGKIADSGSNNGSTFTVTAVAALTLTVSETLNAQTKAQTVSCTLTNYIANLVKISGSNVDIENVHIANLNSDVLSVGGVKVTGARVHMERCHVIGAGHATPGAVAGAYDIDLSAAEEFNAERCTFGTDSVLKAQSNAIVLVDSATWRASFYDCDFLSWSVTAGKGALKSASATAWSGWITFARCRFTNFSPNGMTALTSMFIGTAPTSGYALMDCCSLAGWAAWDSNAANNTVYVANSAAVAAGAGGIATTV